MKHADKLSHLFAGGFIAALIVPVFGDITSMIYVTCAALGKELYDHHFGGTVDFKDALATLFGGMLITTWIQLW